MTTNPNDLPVRVIADTILNAISATDIAHAILQELASAGVSLITPPTGEDPGAVLHDEPVPPIDPTWLQPTPPTYRLEEWVAPHTYPNTASIPPLVLVVDKRGYICHREPVSDEMKSAVRRRSSGFEAKDTDGPFALYDEQIPDLDRGALALAYQSVPGRSTSQQYANLSELTIERIYRTTWGAMYAQANKFPKGHESGRLYPHAADIAQAYERHVARPGNSD